MNQDTPVPEHSLCARILEAVPEAVAWVARAGKRGDADERHDEEDDVRIRFLGGDAQQRQRVLGHIGERLGAPLPNEDRRALSSIVLGALERNARVDGRIGELRRGNVFEVRAVPLEDGCVVFARDVTDLERKVREVREAEARFRTVAQNSPVPLWLTEVDGSSSFLSQRWYDFTGQTPERAAGDGWADAIHPEDREFAMSHYSGGNHQRQPFQFEYRLRRRDGAYRWVLDTGAPRYGEHGDFCGYVGSIVDIHERKEAEFALGLQAALLARTHDAVVVWELGGKIVYFNEGAEHLYGFAQNDAVGRNVHELLGPQPLFQHDARMTQLEREGSWEGEIVRTAQGGRRITVESRQVLRRYGSCFHVMEIDRDVTERRETQAALEEADRHKNEFLAMLGHELRNPLAPIHGALATLNREGLEGPHAKEMLAIMVRQAEHLTRLVDDLLDVSRITHGKIELRKEVVDARTVVARAVEQSRPLIESKGHSLDVTLPQEPLWVEADAGRLAQVLANLLNNAAKYTDPGGRVAIEIHTEGQELVARVEDNGSGIPTRLVPQMFQLFAQGPRSAERAEGGLGVGLTLVQRLVQMHRGRVEGFSNAPRPGSTFVVRLPVVRRISGLHRLGTTAAHAVGVERHPLRILVVDDNVDAAAAMAVYLSLEGHQTKIAHGGEEAIGVARDFDPDVVLLDIGLPGIDGYEVARRLRAQPGLHAKLVALTGYGQEDDRRRALQAGFDRHLTKPVAPDELMAAMATG